MTDAQTLRHQLRDAGFTTLPLFGKAPPQYGKNNTRKGLSGWQKLEYVTDEMIAMWSKTWPNAENTGCLCRNMSTLDVDILDEAAAKAAKEFVRERYEDAGYVLDRIGKPPKFAIPFRTEEPFKKIVVNLIAPDGSEGQKIEFLADGEQVVVAGEHPETKQAYRWSNGGLEQVKLEDLPYTREQEARALVDALVALLIRDHGYKRAPARPKTNGGAKPQAHEGGGGADRDWGALTENILTGRELHDSVTIFAAKLIASGMNSGAAVNYLRGLMDKSAAPKDERWHERVRGIPDAVDSAVAKYGKETHTRSSSPAPAEPATRLPTTESPRLRATHIVFRKWLDEGYDIDILDAVLATAASERLSGDPLWLLVISGPGNAKTETVQALAGAGATITSTIASEGALLSATSRKQKSKGATGGLLRKLGNRGILVIKDVTSILSADRHTRGPVLAAIREIYDGRWDRNVGSDGGQTLTWTGRLVIVGAVTTAWDTAHSVIAAMGDRFVIIRADSSSGRAKSATKAIRNTGSEIGMRLELARAADKLISNINKKECILSNDQISQLIKAADIVRRAHWRRTRLSRRSHRRPCAGNADPVRQAAWAIGARSGGHRRTRRSCDAARHPLRPRQHPTATLRNPTRHRRSPGLGTARSPPPYRPPATHRPARTRSAAHAAPTAMRGNR